MVRDTSTVLGPPSFFFFESSDLILSMFANTTVLTYDEEETHIKNNCLYLSPFSREKLTNALNLARDNPYNYVTIFMQYLFCAMLFDTSNINLS